MGFSFGNKEKKIPFKIHIFFSMHKINHVNIGKYLLSAITVMLSVIVLANHFTSSIPNF